jgi:hypothetical protein
MVDGDYEVIDPDDGQSNGDTTRGTSGSTRMHGQMRNR